MLLLFSLRDETPRRHVACRWTTPLALPARLAEVIENRIPTTMFEVCR